MRHITSSRTKTATFKLLKLGLMISTVPYYRIAKFWRGDQSLYVEPDVVLCRLSTRAPTAACAQESMALHLPLCRSITPQS
ncbi:Uncharacterized protein TCM_000720 [Theobroma cacao]|uniref:Uncharacterized protein n=1 Tax=Theobroma cacao TaxID=3641 RepID=A0A061DI96_THECC|nr:Uncharacterized protein TCM_000720 [Theobroma cacao]